jgi:hypothetical protein
MKTCTKCKQEFPKTSEYFQIRKDRPCGFFSSCRECNNKTRSDWTKNNPDKNREKSKKWSRSNKDKVSKMNKRWRDLQGREKLRQSNKAWRDANPEKSRSNSRSKERRRKARILQNGFNSYTEAQVLELYGTNCYLCDMPINLNAPRSTGKPGWKTGLHIEHFVDISLGGPDTLDNVRPSHGWCNLTKPQRSKDSVELSNGTI